MADVLELHDAPADFHDGRGAMITHHPASGPATATAAAETAGG